MATEYVVHITATRHTPGCRLEQNSFRVNLNRLPEAFIGRAAEHFRWRFQVRVQWTDRCRRQVQRKPEIHIVAADAENRIVDLPICLGDISKGNVSLLSCAYIATAAPT